VRKKTSPFKQKKVALKDLLLKHALLHLKTKDARTLTLRGLARACNVSEAAPYRHFKSKEDLLAAVATQGFQYLGKYMHDALEKGEGNPEAQYFACGQAYLKMGLKHTEHLKLMFGPYVTPSEKFPELWIAAKTSFLTLTRIIKNCQDAGLIGSGDPFHRAMHSWMSVHGFTVLVVDHRCEWLSVSNNEASKAMKVFLNERLNGMRAPLDNSNFAISTPELPEEVLIKFGFFKL
jgi:AcrR family transcriptional regulator